MSGWAFESEETLASQQRSSDLRTGLSDVRSKPRRAFFSDDGDGEESVTSSRSNAKRDSLSLSSRRSQRNNPAELVVDDHDDASPQDEEETIQITKPVKTKSSAAESAPDLIQMPARVSVAVSSAASRSGKLDEIAIADLVESTTHAFKQPASQAPESISSHYVQWLVRDFLVKTYPRNVVEIFDRENPSPFAGEASGNQTIETLHAQVVAGVDTSLTTFLERMLIAWDAQTHQKQLTPSRSRRKESPGEPSASSHSSAREPSTSKTKSSSGCRKKPQLSVTIASEPAITASEDGVPDDGDFNRLNHPGHTPKAHDALLAAVIGQPGSTPKASASELKALGFEDIEVGDATTGSLIPTPGKPDNLDDDTDEDEDGLSKYAKRKRAAGRHHKHVCIGEPGGTPTKEYVFFRETPPRFVTETIEAAEDVLRSIGGNPDARRQQLMEATKERFVELQSSDVAKYSIGQRVQNLGAQRNITGLISKLYGSRQCGTAGPGTVVIDTWNGSDTAPMLDDELLPVASRPATPSSSSR